MGRTAQISKEKILNAALDLLREQGYEALNISRLARRIGCSTQPISWHFKTMDNLRKELAHFTLEYANQKMMAVDGSVFKVFFHVGKTYVDMAFDEPNIVRFLLKDEQILHEDGGIGYVFDEEKNKFLCQALSEQFALTKEDTIDFMQTVVVYTQGLVSMIISEALPIDKEKAYDMLEQIGRRQLKGFGVSEACMEKFRQAY